MLEDATIKVAGRNYILPQGVIRHIQSLPDKVRKSVVYGPAGARMVDGVEQPRYGFSVCEVRTNETIDLIKQSAVFEDAKAAQSAGDELLQKILRLALTD